MTSAGPCSEMQSAGAFYDALAERYDALTATAARAPVAAAFVDRMLARWPVETVLDTACGNGVFTVPLALAGVRTVGVDLSAAMLARGRARAAAAGVSIDWREARLECLRDAVDECFDVVLCMGNSLPHLRDPEACAAAFAGFADCLRSGGHLVVHLINYAQVLDTRERIVDITRHGDREYIRFYDFQIPDVRFNVLEIDWTASGPEHRLTATVLHPYRASELAAVAAASGFHDIRLYGGLELEPFRQDASATVVLIAEKGAVCGQAG